MVVGDAYTNCNSSSASFTPFNKEVIWIEQPLIRLHMHVKFCEVSAFFFFFFLKKIVLLFVLCFMFLIIRPNIVSILLGWDGLGLVSYCLVIYYQNVRSYNAGILTVLSNRVGDVALLIAIA
jgi:NADH:ubiquinone oxidoreductase subunit 5 (subunit L)/multisubunit Na+/H+ antiporter MnhA subunit